MKTVKRKAMPKPGLSIAKRAALAACGITLLAVVLALAMVFRSANQPVSGKIRNATLVSTVADEAGTKTIETPYYSAEYPERYEVSRTPDNSNSVDARVLTAHKEQRFGTSSRISLTLMDMPAQGLNEYGGYKLFASRPEIYTLGQQVVGGDTLIVATRTAPSYEKTWLWPHGSLLLRIDIMTDAASDISESDMDLVLRSLEWKPTP